ncbi:hypothetical protein [Elstera litoralis]|uniref:hypothetical protein n=1 Tax=Elstera litoralis TaxID=552518 RepID=UPI0018DC040B
MSAKSAPRNTRPRFQAMGSQWQLTQRNPAIVGRGAFSGTGLKVESPLSPCPGRIDTRSSPMRFHGGTNTGKKASPNAASSTSRPSDRSNSRSLSGRADGNSPAFAPSPA